MSRAKRAEGPASRCEQTRVAFPSIESSGRSLLCTILISIALATLPRPAFGQSLEPPTPRTSQLGLFAINAALGGVTGGVAALFRGDAVLPSAAVGALGGAAAYGGKRISAERWFGAGLVGRQVASLGSSAVNNVVAGRAAFERVSFAAGPVRVYVWGAHPRHVIARFDAAGAIAVAAGIISPKAELRLLDSVSAGVPVFNGVGEFTVSGVIFTVGTDSPRRSYVLAHERVHVVHYDQAFLYLSDAVENWLFAFSRPTRSINRYVELNLVGLATAFAGAARWEDDQLPWETEARHLGHATDP